MPGAVRDGECGGAAGANHQFTTRRAAGELDCTDVPAEVVGHSYMIGR